MPGLDKEVRILPVTDDAPTGGKDLLDLIGTEERISGVARYTVDGRTERVNWAKGVNYVTGRGVYGHGLRITPRKCEQDQQRRDRGERSC